MNSGRLPPIVIDGYNLLLALARRERVRDVDAQLVDARSRLVELLSKWSDLRERDVTVVWDGYGSAPADLSKRLRVVFVEPPAEADDWIVLEARDMAGRGQPPEVVTRDRGLLERLPAGCESLPLDSIEHDLRAIEGGPVSGSHVSGHISLPEEDGWLVQPADEIDTRRLPRRRSASARPPDVSAGRGKERRAVAGPTATGTDSGRESEWKRQARERREAKRRRWERAQQRRRGRVAR
jgi:hypothetical protein